MMRNSPITVLCQVVLFFALAAVLARPAICAPAPSFQEQIDQLKSRIDELQSSQQSLSLNVSENRNPVHSFLADDLAIGGFFESGIDLFTGPDTRTQVSAPSHVVGLNLSAELSENFRFVSQLLTTLNFPLVNMENDPRAAALGLPSSRKIQGATTAAAPTQAYVEYTGSDLVHIQGGLGYVPFGYALQQRELVLFVRRNGPQLLSDVNYVSPLWSGVHIGGSFFTGSSRMGYDAYSFVPLQTTNTLGGGARLWWTSPFEKISGGISTQLGKRPDSDTYRSFGADLEAHLDPFTVISEAVYTFLHAEDAWTAYVEPRLSISRDVLLYVFADYGDDPVNALSTLAEPYRRLEYGGGLNWLPIPRTRFRLGFYNLDYLGSTQTLSGQKRDLIVLDLSAGVAS
jgi:hypothetical protein